MDVEKLRDFIKSLPMPGLGWDFASGATSDAKWVAQKMGGTIRVEIETKDGEYLIDYIQLTHEIRSNKRDNRK